MDFVLKNSKRSSVALEITPEGTLIVRAPPKYTKAQAEAFIDKNHEWIIKHLPSILAKKQQVEMLSPEEIVLAEKAALIICTQIAEKYSPLMGVKPQSIRITSAKKRFGSCSATDGICFSRYLMLYPVDAITYVVVHELAHILHHDHSRDFHLCVEKFLPQSKAYEKLLQPQYASYINFKKNLEKWSIVS